MFWPAENFAKNKRMKIHQVVLTCGPDGIKFRGG
jgi:hypothetical protein